MVGTSQVMQSKIVNKWYRGCHSFVNDYNELRILLAQRPLTVGGRITVSLVSSLARFYLTE